MNNTSIDALIPHHMVVIAASQGGIKALQRLLSALPAGFPAPVAIVLHRTAKHPYYLDQILSRVTPLTVKLVKQSEKIRPGIVYLAPPDHHLLVCPNLTFDLTDGIKIRHVLSSANPLFASAAEVFKEGVIAVVLTGGDSDGTDGVQSVKAHGGTVIAQDQATSENFAMPHSAIKTGAVDRILPIEQIGPALVDLVCANPIPAG